MRHKPVLWIVVLPILALGCGEEPPAPTVPVTGRVTFEGQPVAGASVDFVPGGGRAPATAVADENGEFELSTFIRGDGAVPGTHTVTVLPPVNSSGAEKVVAGQAGKSASVVPGRYSTPQTTPFEFEVKEGQENHFELKMTRE